MVGVPKKSERFSIIILCRIFYILSILYRLFRANTKLDGSNYCVYLFYGYALEASESVSYSKYL